jgi:hypothetical protein
MKTVKQLKKQTPVFLHNWKEKIDVVGDFENVYMKGEEYRAEKAPYANESYWLENKQQMDEALKKYADINILFASYGTDNYSGDAWVLFEKDGQLFEVNGSHCSCYGLEGQWEPEPVVLEELQARIEAGHFGRDSYSDNEFVQELIVFLGLAPEALAKNT